LGPQHPAIKEPIFLKLRVDGGRVAQAQVNTGYIHRGIEKLMEGKTVTQTINAVERICGICSFVHQNAFTRAVESGMNLECNGKVRFSRTIVGELERIHSHLLWGGVMLHEIGLETLFMYFWRERERVLELFELLTGGRVHHTFNAVGTVNKDFSEAELGKVADYMGGLEKFTVGIKPEIRKSGVMQERYEGVGTLSKGRAKKFCVVGPPARAAGVKFDVRKEAPYDAYGDVDFKVVTDTRGCAMSRTLLRLDEVIQSAGIIRQCVDDFPFKLKLPPMTWPKIEALEATGRCEAPRGEDFHYLKVADDKVERLKIRTPTFANLAIYAPLLEGVDVADVPVIVESLDPCFACMDRVLVVEDDCERVMSGVKIWRQYHGRA